FGAGYRLMICRQKTELRDRVGGEGPGRWTLVGEDSSRTPQSVASRVDARDGVQPNTFGLGGHIFGVYIVNDTSEHVEVRQCSSANGECSHNVIEKKGLDPGREFGINVTDKGNIQWIEIRNASGATLGCLRLSFKKRMDGLRVYVSQ